MRKEIWRRASWGAEDGQQTRHEAGRGDSRDDHRAAGPETVLVEREMKSLSTAEKAKSYTKQEKESWKYNLAQLIYARVYGTIEGYHRTSW